MTIIQGLIASVSSSSGGAGSKSASWNGIWLDPINEGQQQTIEISYNNWDGSIIYYNIIGTGTNPANSADFDNSYGSFNPGFGTGTYQFNFTTNADATIEGNQTYIVTVGTSDGATDIADGTQGTYTIRDSSQNPQVVLDLDPALADFEGYPTSWPDASNRTNNAVLHNPTYSADGGGSFVFNGTNAYADISTLQANWSHPVFSCSIWFKEDSTATPATRTLISKELVFKLRITSEGFINMLADGDGSTSWDTQVTSNGSEHLRHGQWNNLTFTRTDEDAGYVYLNGVSIMSFSGGSYGSNSFPFVIGAYANNDGPADYFQGNIAQVKAWNYARTAEQVWTDFVADVERYIPQAPAFDLTWDTNEETFADESGIQVTVNSTTASVVNDNGALGLSMPGTSGDYIDILGVNYVQKNFTISMVAKFDISSGHYNTLFDGSTLDRLGNGIWANIWNNQLIVGTQDENYGFYNTTDYPNTEIAWWDFVFTNTSVTVYRNGIATAEAQTTSDISKVWYDNLRIGAEYNQAGNTLAGTFYRFKYQKTALTSDQIILQYNDNCGFYELPPVPLSMSFNGTSSYLEVAGATGDWALGNDYTIEWWEKPNTTDWGTIMSASANEADVHNTIDILTYQYNAYPNRQGWGAGQIPAGKWGHFAVVVTDNSTYKMYVNGVQVYTNNFPSYDLTDTHDKLRIGRSVRTYPSWYNGKLTGIRISDKALYSTNFVPELSQIQMGKTKFMLTSSSGFVDQADYNYTGLAVSASSDEAGGITYLKFAKNMYGQAYDPSGYFTNLTYTVQEGDVITETSMNGSSSPSTVQGDVFDDGTYIVIPVLTSWVSTTALSGGGGFVSVIRAARTITNNNVSVSTDVPHAATGLQHPYDGGTFGSFYVLYGDPNLMSGLIETIPEGASITSNIPNFGLRTVTYSGPDPSGWRIQYDYTGLTGSTSTSNVFNFYW